jgi:hypothetical protein
MFEFGMTLELIQNSDMNLPPYLSKRIAELDERITESEVWRDPMLYCLLQQWMNQQNESKVFRRDICEILLGHLKVSALAKFYEFVVSPVDSTHRLEDVTGLRSVEVKIPYVTLEMHLTPSPSIASLEKSEPTHPSPFRNSPALPLHPRRPLSKNNGSPRPSLYE